MRASLNANVHAALSTTHHTPQVILVALLGYGCAAAFLHVYDLAIGTILLCFCEDFKVHEYTSDWTCKQVPSCVRSCPHRIIIILHNAAEMQTTICARCRRLYVHTRLFLRGRCIAWMTPPQRTCTWRFALCIFELRGGHICNKYITRGCKSNTFASSLCDD